LTAALHAQHQMPQRSQDRSSHLAVSRQQTQLFVSATCSHRQPLLVSACSSTPMRTSTCLYSTRKLQTNTVTTHSSWPRLVPCTKTAADWLALFLLCLSRRRFRRSRRHSSSVSGIQANGFLVSVTNQQRSRYLSSTAPGFYLPTSADQTTERQGEPFGRHNDWRARPARRSYLPLPSLRQELR